MKRSLFVLIICATFITGCAKPQVHTQGYVIKEKELNMLNIGQSNKKDVLRTLGTPSTIGAFDGQKWYYISEKITTHAMDKKELNSREIIELNFNTNDILTSIHFKDKNDGRYITPSTRTTKTQGDKLTIMEQMFGNLGKGL